MKLKIQRTAELLKCIFFQKDSDKYFIFSMEWLHKVQIYEVLFKRFGLKNVVDELSKLYQDTRLSVLAVSLSCHRSVILHNICSSCTTYRSSTISIFQINWYPRELKVDWDSADLHSVAKYLYSTFIHWMPVWALSWLGKSSFAC